jgi:molybdopterin molybdotransferase
MTGAPLPTGATAVVPVESTDGATDAVAIRACAKDGQHIRRAGEDVTAGTTVLRAGQVVTPAVLGLAAALGLGELNVIPRQRVLVMSTGSELVAPGAPLQPGQIYESNAVMLAAAVRDAGALVLASPMTGDDVDAFRDTLGRYTGEADLIITTGGVSAGAYEVVKEAFGRASDGSVEFVKVAMQPGMPQGAGRVNGTPIITLPGNPVSALVSFEVFIRSPLRTAMGLPNPDRPRLTALLTEDLTSPRGKRQFRRGVLNHASQTGKATVTSYGPPASHHLRWLASANCLLEIDEDVAEVAAGSQVYIWDLT